MTRQFTGFHITLIIVTFFAVVVAVNVTMAIAASRTFGGAVVDNSYVAGQRFNGWLAAARAQARLGWRSRVTLGADRRIGLDLATSNGPIVGAEVRAIARHPLGRSPDLNIVFSADGGHYRSDVGLPAGRWSLQIEARRGRDVVRLVETVS